MGYRNCDLATTIHEFAEKHADLLADEHYGLVIHNEKVIEYLDALFKNLKEYGIEFEYYQIKMKYGSSRFYSSLPEPLNEAIEAKINSIIKNTEDDEQE